MARTAASEVRLDVGLDPGELQLHVHELGADGEHGLGA